MSKKVTKTQRVLASSAVAFLVGTTLPAVPAFAVDASPISATPTLAGTDRIDTAIKIAEASWAGAWKGSTNAVLAASTDANLVDALAVAPLAYKLQAPILLSGKGDTITAATLKELTDRNVKTVYIASGSGVITDAAKAQLEKAGFTVYRLGGNDRYETAKNIAKALEVAGVTSKEVAVVNGQVGLADALSVAPIAAQKGMTIALASDKNTAPTTVDLTGKTVYAIGGTGVLSDALVTKLDADRLGGDSRYETNAAVIDGLAKDVDFGTVYLADGANKHLVDSLTGSVYAAQTKSPIVLTGTELDDTQAAVLKDNLTKDSKVAAFGGTVSADVQAAVEALVTPTPVTDALKVDSVSAITTKTLVVTLDSAATTVDASQFAVKDASGKALSVTSAKLAGWDTDNKTVLVTLGANTTSGTLYTLTSGTSTVNFGGRAADTNKPTVTSVISKDYNKVDITFSEPVNIDTVKASFAAKYGDKAALAITKTVYVAGDPTTIEFTTADQIGSTLYGIDVTNVADFSGNVMDENNTATFVGTAKDTTTKLVPASVTTQDSKTLLVQFNTKVDTTAIANVANYVVNEAYGSQAQVSVVSARMATTDDAGIANSTAAAKAVVLTLGTSMKDSTLYKLAVNGLSTYTGVAIDTTANSLTFVGKAPYSTTMDLSNTTVTTLSNTKVELHFDRPMNKDLLVAGNFTIAKVYGDKAALTVSGVSIINNQTVDLTVASMTGDLYQLTVSNLKDVDGNLFDSAKSTKTFVGAAVAAKIQSVGAALQGDSVTLRLTFDQNVGATATDVSHYSIDGGIGYPLKAVTVTGNAKQVDLTIPKTSIGKVYTLTVKGLENSDGALMDTAGITTQFVGAGVTAALPTVQAVTAVDNETLKVYFDKAVNDASIDGAGKLYDDTVAYNTASSNLIAGAIKVNDATHTTTGTAVDLSTIAGTYAYADPSNSNALIIKVPGTVNFARANALTSGTFTVTVDGTKVVSDSSANVLTLAPNDNAPAAFTIDGVQAINNQTVRLFFSAPVTVTTTDFAKIALNSADTYTTGSNLTLSNAIAANSSKTAYDFKVSAPFTDTNIKYLIVNPSVTSAKISDIGGLVTLKDEDTTATGINQVRQFAAATTAPSSVADVQVVMPDAKTVVMYYSDGMNTAAAPSTASVLDAANFTLTDKAGTTLSSTFFASHVTNAVWDATANKATFTLDSVLPTTTNGYGVKFAQTIANAVGTRYVQTTDSTPVALVKEFAPSSVAAAKVTFSSATYSAGTLTVKLNQKATDADTVDVNDLKITIKVSGSDYVLQASDIASVTGPTTTSSDTITITLQNTVHPDASAVGKVEFVSGTNLTGIDGEAADTTSTTVFGQ